MEVCRDSATQYGESERELSRLHPKAEIEHTNTQVTNYVHSGDILLHVGISTGVL
jgi:hypothetical protein